MRVHICGEDMKWYFIVLIVVVAVAILLLVGLYAFGRYCRYYYFHTYRPNLLLERRDDWAKEITEENMNKTIFFGDSITEMCNLGRFYPTIKAFNRGIGGDSTYHLIERLSDIYAMKPKLIVILVGVNDFMNDKRNTDDVVMDYDKMLSEIKKNLPNTMVICQSCYPGSDGKKFKLDKWQGSILLLNEKVLEMTKKYGYVYANVYPKLLNEKTNKLDPEYTLDGCHMNDNGYKVISEYLTPIIEDALL